MTKSKATIILYTKIMNIGKITKPVTKNQASVVLKEVSKLFLGVFKGYLT